MKRKVILTMCLLVAVMTAWAQKVNVTGQVTDEQGEPLIGVTVKVLGTTTGSVTDFEGNYSVSVDKGSSLEFSYIGYKPITVKVTKEIINVSLKEDNSVLGTPIVWDFNGSWQVQTMWILSMVLQIIPTSLL